MKDYDEYISELLPELRKNGILILDKMSGNARYHLVNAVKRTPDVSCFTMKTDKRVVLRYMPRYDEYINWGDYMKRAEDTYNANDYNTCIEIYTTLSRLGVPKANIYARLGFCYYYTGNRNLAIDYLTVATDLGKQNNDDSFDFTDMINDLKMLDIDEVKPAVEFGVSEFKEDDCNDTIEDIEQIADDLCSGMSLSDICSQRGLNNQQKSIILITLAKEHYIQGNNEVGDKYLRIVERTKNKSEQVKKMLQNVTQNKKLYQNKGVEGGHKCLKLSLKSKI